MISRKEFELSLMDPIPYWSEKSKEEVRDLIGGDAAAMVGFDQRNPHHDMDLMEHTIAVVDNIGVCGHPLLRTAGFFHDIGKPQVMKEKKDGTCSYHGHAERSAEIALDILLDLGYEQDEVDIICFWIRYHDAFMLMRKDEKDELRLNAFNVSEKIRKIMDARENFAVFSHTDPFWAFENLAILMRADAMAHKKETVKNGEIVDTRDDKVERSELVGEYITYYFENEGMD